MQEALYTFTNGLYIIGACNAPHYAGALVDALTQISADPPLVMLSMMNHSHTKSCIDKTNEFSISVLSDKTPPFLIANFGFQSGQNIKKWEQIEYRKIKGLPYIDDCIAKLRAKVIDKIKYPHNTLFIAEIIETYEIKENNTPLTYKHYRDTLKPLCYKAFQKNTACDIKTAPHEKGLKILDISKKWTCTLCHYEYKGDIPFEDLDINWRCPLCGVGKDMFKLI